MALEDVGVHSRVKVLADRLGPDRVLKPSRRAARRRPRWRWRTWACTAASRSLWTGSATRCTSAAGRCRRTRAPTCGPSRRPSRTSATCCTWACSASTARSWPRTAKCPPRRTWCGRAPPRRGTRKWQGCAAAAAARACLRGAAARAAARGGRCGVPASAAPPAARRGPMGHAGLLSARSKRPRLSPGDPLLPPAPALARGGAPPQTLGPSC